MSDRTPSKSPDWGALYTTAEGQQGLFTTRQAAQVGYSPQLLHKYLESGKIVRIRRGIYRLVHFPAMEHEDLVTLWLWSEQKGVFSHETALSLHDLSDVLPSRVHMTVPAAWRQRRLRTPEGLRLHFADLREEELSSREVVPLTAPLRTLRDVIDADLSPDLVEQAVQEARQRGLISSEDEADLMSQSELAA